MTNYYKQDEFIASRKMHFKANGAGTDADPHVPQVSISSGDLGLDAWGRMKAITDKSILHGMFTYGIPSSYWYESINDVEQTTLTNSTTDSGLAVVAAGATLNDNTVLRTFRSARYEPNRGQLYSSSIILPSPTAAGQRDFGMFTSENGVFFRLKSDGNLYACRRTTDNGGPTTTTTEELIDLSGIPNLDLSKGNIFDIQMQWRGVGNIKFFIGNPDTGVSQLVHTMDILGTLTALSISNPALPLAFESENLGANVEIHCGCCDISTEGGVDENHLYGSISVETTSGQIALPAAFNTPVLAVRNKKLNGSLVNVRDIQAFALYAFADQRAFVRVWQTRDETALTLGTQTWTDFRDGFVEYVFYDPGAGTPLAFDTAKAEIMFGARVDQDTTFHTAAMYDGKSEIHQSPGDIFIFTLHRETGGTLNGGVAYEFGEEL